MIAKIDSLGAGLRLWYRQVEPHKSRPEVFRLIARRTKNTSYWVRYWPAYQSVVDELIGEMVPEEVGDDVLYYTQLHLASYLHDRNRAALKARGF